MTDPIYAGGEARILFAVEDFDSTSPLGPGDVTSVKVTITDDVGSVVVGASNMSWVPALSSWSFVWTPIPADAGGRAYRAESVAVDLTGGEIVAWSYLVVDASPSPVLLGGCGAPWGSPASLSGCASDVSASDQELAARAATGLLYAATGRQFSGICTDVVRPPSANTPGGSWFQNPAYTADGGLWLGQGGTGALPESTFGGYGVQTADVASSSGFVFSSVHLPGVPIVDVLRITIDGVDLPAGSWLIVDDKWIVRRDGQSWPLWQRLDRPAGETDTWDVEYTWGNAIPPEGMLAWRVLGCELVKSLAEDSSCRLPKRLQSITREGVTAVVLDPFKFLDEGKFGIYEIDVFVLSVNPHRLSRDGKVLNPDLLGQRPYRVR